MRIANARGGMKLLFRQVGQRCRLCVAHLAVPASSLRKPLPPSATTGAAQEYVGRVYLQGDYV